METLKIFVSHARAGKNAKPCLKACLETIAACPGLEAVVDEYSIRLGEKWRAEIYNMVDQSHGALLILTQEALESEWVQHEAREIDRAYVLYPHQYRVVPILVGISSSELKSHPAWRTFHFPEIQNLKVQGASEIRHGRLAARLKDWLNGDKELIRHQRTVFLGHLPNVADSGLFGRASNLKRLTLAWFDVNVNIITLEATGGIGKSAVVRKWLADIQNSPKGAHLGAKRVYGWSFYSQGTNDKRISADSFLQHALRHFGDPQPEMGDNAAWGSRLLQLMRRERTLLILDGLEPLQYPQGELEGSIKDAGLRTLITGLAADCGGGALRHHNTRTSHRP